jgi:DNA modification methylase
MADTLYFGDNLHILRKYIHPDTVDLIYLDPPFNANATFNVFYPNPMGGKSRAQAKAFTDSWKWGLESERALIEIEERRPDVKAFIDAIIQLISKNATSAYLAMMTVRLIELHRVLKPSGSLYLHCDPTASHYIKIILDAIFGYDNYRNEIIWRNTGSHNSTRSFGPIHQDIHFYSKTAEYKFNVVRRPYMRGHVETRYTRQPDGRMKFTSGGNVLTGKDATKGPSGEKWRGFDPTAKRRHWAIPSVYEAMMPASYPQLTPVQKLEALHQAGLVEIQPGAAWPIMVRYLDERDGVPLQDIWAYQPYTQGTVWDTRDGIDADVEWLGPTDPDRLNFETQKPVGLLERIIRASSGVGDTVLDPFCGCGSTIEAAQKLERKWIGIDVAHNAIDIVEDRLRELKRTLASRIDYEVIGRPIDPDGARELARRDKYGFQFWAVSMIGGSPRGGEERKGPDAGVDGEIFFKLSARKNGKGVISVKAGRDVHPDKVRELIGTRVTQGADAGVFVCLGQATPDMERAASNDGFVTTDFGQFPRCQIISVEEIFARRAVDLPLILPAAAVAEEARKQQRPRTRRVPPAEQLRRQPSLRLPITGGRRAPDQKPLDLDEPILQAPRPTRRRRT